MSLFKNTQKDKKEQEVDDGEDENYDPETEVVGNWKICDLPEIPTVTGQEEEELAAKFRSKIYRWRNEWKERGVGELKFLKHKKTGLLRILVRAEKTHKCVVNHLVQAKDIFCKLQQMKTSNNAWTWAAYDIADEKPETEKFCAKFTSKDDFENFKTEFEKACESNEKILAEMKTEEVGEKKEEAEKKAEQPAEKPAEEKKE